MDYVIVWRYRVAADSSHAFERAYGPGGPWARLFGHHAGFLGTELVRGDEPGEYLTIDRWTSREAFQAFEAGARDEYESLDAELAALTMSEELVARGTA